MSNTLLLSGIVGSTAYGLAGPDSDVDRLGVFAAPTEEFLGLRRPTESIVSHHPDRTLHEVAKWLRLAIGGNPTVTELVWLPEELYETVTDLGRELIELRSALLSAQRVRDSYFGYATQQFTRLERRGDSFSSETRNRTSKHARHLARLLDQGLGLYRTGTLTVRLEDPESYHEFGRRVADGDLDLAQQRIAAASHAFDEARPALPEHPDEERADAWLTSARLRLLHGTASITAGAEAVATD
ncbi:nucleotidyltransferase domain-containing protein [Virgisporangium aliadipatigenens]|uniref:nucleotidyltransferase domain-containing protein n=1 Tax=Virgisporangium aliadipatigenens TaxID=741659 RepID=UPI0019415444|nr:nucleotidyltransferase domain-containing protein [Virgisporangium aliadipatigenens]